MNSYFVESIDLREHPIRQYKKRAEYYSVLSYFVHRVMGESIENTDKKLILERLHTYSQITEGLVDGNANPRPMASVTSWLRKLWRRKYRLFLVCDLALILLREETIRRAVTGMQNGLSKKQVAETEELIAEILGRQAVIKKHLFLEPLIGQYRKNQNFMQSKERRIIVTANVSAGKSTLINALTGKNIARTSQEICTGTVSYIFNKPFEDGNIHLWAKDLNFTTMQKEIPSSEWQGKICVASYFPPFVNQMQRLCLIDTPGVDAALHKEHRSLAYNTLKNETYDIVLSIVCPTRLGTDAEKAHLRWLSQNVSHDKIIFILNKLDDYHDSDDSIEESVEGLRGDLLAAGFENPIVCPLSAYFSYLLKLKMTGQELNEDEEDEYACLAKKFKRSFFDLSHYYQNVQVMKTDSEEIMLSKRSGLYGLEKIIYGGKA